MTALGKILVFFNLLFSLGVGYLAVLNYSTRTYWAAGYKELETKATILSASGAAHQKQARELQDEKDQTNKRLVAILGKSVEIKDPNKAAEKVAATMSEWAEQIRQQKADIARLNDSLTAERKKSALEEMDARAAKVALASLQGDVDKIKATLTAQTARNIDLVKEKNELRDRAVGAEIQAKSFKDINGRLEVQLQDAIKDLARARANVGSSSVAARGGNPPPENVEGLIKRTDPNSGLVTITIGSDAGLSKGNTMEVFRLGATPKYVGRIKIIEVTSNQAVGQVMGRLNGSIQVNDHVASRIMAGN